MCIRDSPIQIGNTGHAMLLDTQGTPLICPVLPPTAHLIPSALMNRLTLDRPLWLVAENDAHGGRDAIVGAAPVRLTPVSYTHLDVYKRQLMSSLVNAS